MHDNHRKVWSDFVHQAQVHIEGEDPMVEDAMIIRVDMYMKGLEKRVADFVYAEDIRLSRTMSIESAEQLVIEQITNEELTKGNV